MLGWAGKREAGWLGRYTPPGGGEAGAGLGMGWAAVKNPFKNFPRPSAGGRLDPILVHPPGGGGGWAGKAGWLAASPPLGGVYRPLRKALAGTVLQSVEGVPPLIW